MAGARLLLYIWAFPNTLLGLLFVPLTVATRGHARVVEGVIEIHGALPRWALRLLAPMPGGASAITLGHVVIGRDRTALAITRRHERVHVRQYEIWGPFFIPAYLVASLWAFLTGAGAYDGNYFEREAVRRS